jgi:uncharacterized membrane protein YraQ (UPF0718 family)
MSEASNHRRPWWAHVGRGLRGLATYDVFPEFSARVRRLMYNPLGVMSLAALTALLCGLFLHPRGLVLFAGVAAVTALGVAWPWLSLRGLHGSVSFARARGAEGEPVEVRLTLRNGLPWSAWGLAVRGGFSPDPQAHAGAGPGQLVPAPRDARAAPPRLVLLLLLALAAAPFPAEPLRRRLGGEGYPLELQRVFALRNLGLGLAACAGWLLCLRLAGVVSLFLALFAVPITDHPAVPAFLGLYAAAGSVWLVLVHWAGLHRSFAAAETAVVLEERPGRAPLPWAAVVVAVGREAVGPTMGYVLVGLGFTGLLSGFLPHGCLSTTMRHDEPLSPALMAALALPLYVGPLQGMMRLGLMFEHGNSVGAAFALFELGIGLNLGMIAWLVAQLGWRRVAPWLALVTAATLALGYAAERPLYFAHEEASHTHAFDDWTSPFGSGQGSWEEARGKLLAKVEVLEPVSLAGLALLVLVGLAAVKFDPHGRLEAWLAQPPPARPRRSVWDRDVPGPVLGLAALGGLIVFSVLALYVYYPAPKEAFDTIVRVRADALVAVNSGHAEEAVRQLEQWDLLTRKLPVGVFIRTGRLDPEAAQLAEDLRERLEEVRDALLAGELAEAKGMLPKVEAAYRQCRAVYLPGPARGNS